MKFNYIYLYIIKKHIMLDIPKTENINKIKNKEKIKKCKKWLLLNDDIAKEYDISVIVCRNCRHYAFPYFVHNEHGFGDYTCHVCDESGDVQSYCVYCKQRRDPSIRDHFK